MFTIFFANSWPLSSEFSYLKLWNFSLSSFMIFFHALADSSFTAPLWANNNAADNNCSKHNFKHQSNVWNLFKVNNIDIRTLAMEFYFKHCFLLALVRKERKKTVWGYLRLFLWCYYKLSTNIKHSVIRYYWYWHWKYIYLAKVFRHINDLILMTHF